MEQISEFYVGNRVFSTLQEAETFVCTNHVPFWEGANDYVELCEKMITEI